MQRATHRNGQHGTVSEPDANGFRLFTSDTGARFTVAAHEFALEGNPPPKPAREPVGGLIVRRVVREEGFGRIERIVEDAPIMSQVPPMRRGRA